MWTFTTGQHRAGTTTGRTARHALRRAGSVGATDPGPLAHGAVDGPRTAACICGGSRQAQAANGAGSLQRMDECPLWLSERAMPGGESLLMHALVINCTLKPSPQPSNTEALATIVITALEGHGVAVDVVRAVDLNLKPGVEIDMREDDDWPGVHEKLLAAQILVVASPTWLGRPSSVAQRVLERMDAMVSETDDQDRPVAYNRVAGVLVTGNEDGAHHVISEISGALGDIG